MADLALAAFRFRAGPSVYQERAKTILRSMKRARVGFFMWVVNMLSLLLLKNEIVIRLPVWMRPIDLDAYCNHGELD